jgi:hypothetical protein
VSDITRSIDITVYNALAINLIYKFFVSSGPAPIASVKTIASNNGVEFKCSSTKEACQGKIGIYDGKTAIYTIHYSASSDKSKTGFSVDVDTDAGYVGGVNSEGSGDHSIVARLTCYQGQITTTGGYAVPLGSDPMDSYSRWPWIFSDFINGMFDPAVRNIAGAIGGVATTISDSWASTAGALPPVYYADLTGNQIPAIVKMWANYWKDGTPCAKSDQRIIDFLKRFVEYKSSSTLSGEPAPVLHLPRLSFVRFDGTGSTAPAVFKLHSYDALNFRKPDNSWNRDTIERFLTLLATGAHVVLVRAKSDLGSSSYSDVMDLRDLLTDSGLKTRGDPGNSHYTSIVNLTGYYYLDIESEVMPEKVSDGKEKDYTGLIVAFMTAKTVSDLINFGDYNTFFQLEGWPAQGVLSGGFSGGPRHSQDYEVSGDVYWNVSTFAASPYSEKRGTSVFLAPPGWQPVPTQMTMMMPYCGAYAIELTQDGRVVYGPGPQGWLQTRLIEIPSDARDVPSPDLIIKPLPSTAH